MSPGAGFPEIRIPLPSPRVEGDEILTGERDDSRVPAVGPVREAPARAPRHARWQRSGRGRGRVDGAVWWHVEPDDLSGGRIERGCHADSRAHVEQPVDHQRRVLGDVRHRRVGPSLPKLGGNDRLAPGDAQARRGIAVDLVERRVAAVRFVGGVGAPFARARLCPGRSGRQPHRGAYDDDEGQNRAVQASPLLDARTYLRIGANSRGILARGERSSSRELVIRSRVSRTR